MVGPQAHDPRIAELRGILRMHAPADPIERCCLHTILEALDRLSSPFDELADTIHVTGSAIVTDGHGHIVLHRHRSLGIWLQPGGHVEGDESVATAAQRETLEETGLVTRHLSPDHKPLHVDVHPGPRGHTHLDLRYLLAAESDQGLTPGPMESPEVAWFTHADALAIADASLAAALRAIGHL